ncbi:hypothetical protein A7U60_g6276 [Sanghuangporus baumii]|uniref:Uncharacterized protein n=1 Tax=Sanghuangporus baumii TaxID=108892 RepID=A0A9Q5N7E4_SANBA|nr:hypothetical protein A7U60_g6276 [Sanghuangporus baumii]
MPFRTKKQASRKFIDLINRAGTIWANWKPSIPIKPGFYGTIDEKTGEFQKKGDIFSPDFDEPEIKDIVNKYLLISAPPVDIQMIRSFDAKKIAIDPKAHVNIFGIAEPTFGGQWQFGRTRGALLVLYKPRITRLPDELLEKLKETEWGQGKQIVTEAHSCPGFVLYLSDKSKCSYDPSKQSCTHLEFTDKEMVTISLRADVPVNAGVTAGAGIKVGWVASGATGNYIEAYTNEPVYVPLYQIKEIGKMNGRRGKITDPVNEDWVPVKVPWKSLDDDGEELHDLSDDEDSDQE